MALVRTRNHSVIRRKLCSPPAPSTAMVVFTGMRSELAYASTATTRPTASTRTPFWMSSFRY
eukprot:5147541-Pyramimonas_sp.AAC.1